MTSRRAASASPLISVILPARNAAPTVEAALESVLAQTCGAFEVLAIDDGSIDGTGEKLQRAADRDERVRVIRTEGVGTTAALVQGAALARGEFLARQDADDVSLPDRFARQLEFLNARPHVCAVGTAAVVVDEAGRERARFPTAHGPVAVRRGLQAARVTPVHGSMMIRRASFEAIGGYRPAFAMAQDFDLWLRLVERWDIDNLDQPLYRWRLNADSASGPRRSLQVMYGGIGLAFAAERRRHGSDSYARLAACDGDLEGFAAGYRLQGVLRALWGELLFRATGDARIARRHLRLALRHGHVRARTLLLCGWTSMGLPWIGGAPLRAERAA